MSNELSNSKLITAALSAAASSLLTYAVFKWNTSQCWKGLKSLNCETNQAETPQRLISHNSLDNAAHQKQSITKPKIDPYDPRPREGYSFTLLSSNISCSQQLHDQRRLAIH